MSSVNNPFSGAQYTSAANYTKKPDGKVALNGEGQKDLNKAALSIFQEAGRSSSDGFTSSSQMKGIFGNIDTDKLFDAISKDGKAGMPQVEAFMLQADTNQDGSIDEDEKANINQLLSTDEGKAKVKQAMEQTAPGLEEIPEGEDVDTDGSEPTKPETPAGEDPPEE